MDVQWKARLLTQKTGLRHPVVSGMEREHTEATDAGEVLEKPYPQTSLRSAAVYRA